MKTPPHASSPRALIFLVGFMGAGKTTVGQALADVMGWRFVDLDRVIEAREGQTVREIFETRGEPEFRRIEREAIAACGEMSETVISLGGGAYIAEANRALMRELGLTVWLDCPLEVCLSRIGGDVDRPLLRGREEMGELFERRRPAYAVADLMIETGDRSPEELAAEILKLLPGH
ncbi:MAG TPA: shikimate kinase [Blastocatellia bacterium]|nr:shikimate kinase [Blastocatellia bacterium]